MNKLTEVNSQQKIMTGNSSLFTPATISMDYLFVREKMDISSDATRNDYLLFIWKTPASRYIPIAMVFFIVMV